MERNVLLTIAYDGSTFHGWQKQPAERTVQGHLEQVMSRLFDREILLNGTSRTDAGVHTLGQRASFNADLGIPIEKMALVINNALCAAEGGGYAKAPLRILKAEEMPPDFHARFNSKGKEYIYRIRDGINAVSNDDLKITLGNGTNVATHMCMATDLSLVFEKNYVYHVGEQLDVCAMNEAAQYFVGKHDFKSFEAAGSNPRETTVRTMTEARVVRIDTGGGETTKETNSSGTGDADGHTGCMVDDEKCNGIIEFHIKGNGFLYNMVRIMTGTLVEVGQGKREPEEIAEIVEAKDRAKAGHTAPPNGLYLAEVFF